MKRIFLIIAIAIVGAQNFVPLHAQTVTGPVREIKFTTLPKYDKNAGVKGMYGYEVEITFKYRFQLCAGVITLNGYRTANTAVAYWVAGKRYSWGDLRVFNIQNKTNLAFATGKSDLYPNLDFEADIWTYDKGNAGTTSFFAKGKWIWVNLPDWGGCLGDYGNGSSGDYKQYEPKMTSTNKDRVGSLFLKDVKPKDAPNRDFALEAALSGKKQRPLEEFKDVKQVTENLKNEAKTEDANRRGKARLAPTRNPQTDDDLLNSTGYGSDKEITNRQLAAADAAAQNVSSFSDRTHLLEAKRLYEKALAADLNATTPDQHANNQLKRIEWILKNGDMVFVEGNGSIRSFSIGRYEVTQAKWKEVMGSYFVRQYNDNGSVNSDFGENKPVQYVRWEEAQDFIRKLNSQTGQRFRLPTEEEWEYAARGGKLSKGYKYSGSNEASEVAQFGNGPQPIGARKPNELGIYDMTGNVWEWCVESCGNNSHTIRGGGWNNGADDWLPMSRNKTCWSGSGTVGFRLALDEK